MIQPHFKDLGFQGDYALQRASAVIETSKAKKLKLIRVIEYFNINLPPSFKMISNKTSPGEACMESEKFILTHKIFKELLQWRIADREFKLEPH
ncbi:hypothetical protein O181_106627 [Austropuccinia psidii MF-1]|uniref:Uncharacterized protein n=1 Tax=Austropuccinia psidii MF-1 TaxID=1389203 RepID=A0A9Q3JSE9_9BASI|nr:hypothetical protein [Austropuccinia psidii MF-1]